MSVVLAAPEREQKGERLAVSGIIVTRGDVELDEIVESLSCLDEVIVWDNSEKRIDFMVYGRYAAIEYARNDVIYVQDDDCIVPAGELVALHETGYLVANMPRSRWSDYPDSSLLGWGAVFDRELPERAFDMLREHARELDVPNSPFFRLTCDVAFSALTWRHVHDFGFRHLPWAEGDDRMFRQPLHKESRDHMLDVCRKVRELAEHRDSDMRFVDGECVSINGEELAPL